MEQQPFVDRHWLWHNGLRRETVLDYFAQSRFYDRASCNEELRMQGAIVRAALPTLAYDGGMVEAVDRSLNPSPQTNNQQQDVRAEHLKGMTGVQYLAEEVPGPTPEAPIFVIQKLLRAGPEQEPQVRGCLCSLHGLCTCVDARMRADRPPSPLPNPFPMNASRCWTCTTCWTGSSTRPRPSSPS